MTEEEKLDKLGKETEDRRLPEEELLEIHDEDNIPWPMIIAVTLGIVLIVSLGIWLI